VETLSKLVNWLFRDRNTGRFVVGQFPNIPLIVWLAATLLAAVSTGGVHTFFSLVATLGLVIWAGDEVIRGVNPFRRILGAVVLTWKLYSLARGG
jgi:hypothetical protein